MPKKVTQQMTAVELPFQFGSDCLRREIDGLRKDAEGDQGLLDTLVYEFDIRVSKSLGAVAWIDIEKRELHLPANYVSSEDYDEWETIEAADEILQNLKGLLFSDEQLAIAIYSEQCILKGKVCQNPEDEYGEHWCDSADLHVHEGTAEDLLDEIHNLEAKGGQYRLMVAQNLRRHLMV